MIDISFAMIFYNQWAFLFMNAALTKLTGFLPKPAQYVIIAISCTYWIGMQINLGFSELRTDLVSQARQPAYEIIFNQVEKQAEKLVKDPDDIKNADLKFLYNQCNGDFKKVYISSLIPSEAASVNNACKKISELYFDKRY